MEQLFRNLILAKKDIQNRDDHVFLSSPFCVYLACSIFMESYIIIVHSFWKRERAMQR